MRGARKTKEFVTYLSNPFTEKEPRRASIALSGIELLGQLNNRGKDLFCYILCHISKNQSEITLKQSEVIKLHPHFAGDAFYVAISNLLEYEFIARKRGVKGQYFLNPNLFELHDTA